MCPAAGLSAARRPVPFEFAPVVDAVREVMREIGRAPLPDDGGDGCDPPRRVAEILRDVLGHRDDTPWTGVRQASDRWDLESSCHDDGGPHGDHGDVIFIRDVPLFGLCDEHLLPYVGRAHVAYVHTPGRAASTALLARAIDRHSTRRPQSQSTLTDAVAEAVADHAGARGVAVVVEAEHVCLALRGAPRLTVHTAALLGWFREDHALGREVLHLLKNVARGPTAGGLLSPTRSLTGVLS